MKESKLKQSEEIKPVHVLIDSALKTSKPVHVSLYEIAERCGFQRKGTKVASPTMSMLRSGSMRLPMDKVVIVADTLGIDRRTLFTAQLRDSVKNLIVKTGIPSKPIGRPETENETLNRNAAIVTRASQVREFNETWKSISSMFSFTHSDLEAPLIEALREVKEEVGHEIVIDDTIINNFKNMLRDQYSL